MTIDDIYTPINEAKKEIEKRWNDVELKKKVSDYLGKDFPEVFKKEPRAILSRGILTPNFETKYFLDILDIVDLKPICLEFYGDKFCSQNKDKIHLGKLVFLHDNKKGINVTTKRTIIDFKKSENKIFKEIRTLQDKSFTEFHHNLYIRQYKKLFDIFDISVFKDNGESAKEVYKKIFGLCLVNGILFENFIAKENEHEKKFTENVVLPAFEFVVSKFHVKPLVVPLLPLKNVEKEAWDWYPSHLEKEIDNL